MNPTLALRFALCLALATPMTAFAGEKSEEKREQEQEQSQEQSEDESRLDLEKSVDESDKPDPLYGFGGLVLLSNSVGKGTFASGLDQQALWNMTLSLRPHYTISKKHKVKVQLALDISQNIVENFGSTNTRPHDVQLSDLRLTFSWAQFAKIKAANLTFNGSLRFYAPTSRLSDLTGKLFGTRLAAGGTYKPTSWFTLGYTFLTTKNFHRYTNPVVDVSEFDFPLPTRAGGNEAVAEGIVATGGQNTEWTLTHSASLGFKLPADITLDVGFAFYHLFTYSTFPKDEKSSPNAVAGKGYNEVMVGSIELGYSITDWLSLALGTSTEQTPLTSDNSSVRFPFWDTTNGSANRQTFYLDLAGSF